MQILTDTSRAILEVALVDAKAERASLLAKIERVEVAIEQLLGDLGILTEPTDPDEPVPFEIIDDPWAAEA